MATIRVCDACGRQQDKMPFTVTEKGGEVWEACSARCFIDHTATIEGTRS